MCRDFGLADIFYAPSLERLAANLPVLRHVHLRDAERRPNLAAWFQAMEARPSFARVKSDDYTHNLLARHGTPWVTAAAPCNWGLEI